MVERGGTVGEEGARGTGCSNQLASCLRTGLYGSSANTLRYVPCWLQLLLFLCYVSEEGWVRTCKCHG